MVPPQNMCKNRPKVGNIGTPVTSKGYSPEPWAKKGDVQESWTYGDACKMGHGPPQIAGVPNSRWRPFWQPPLKKVTQKMRDTPRKRSDGRKSRNLVPYLRHSFLSHLKSCSVHLSHKHHQHVPFLPTEPFIFESGSHNPPGHVGLPNTETETA